mgnify:CR=1 FL=1
MPPLLILIFAGSILTLGDIIFKFYALSHKPLLYIYGLVLYIIGMLFLVQTFKTENIATASAIFVIANILTLSVVSWFYFNEQLSAVQIAGLLLAVCAILLLELGK